MEDKPHGSNPNLTFLNPISHFFHSRETLSFSFVNHTIVYPSQISPSYFSFPSPQAPSVSSPFFLSLSPSSAIAFSLTIQITPITCTQTFSYPIRMYSTYICRVTLSRSLLTLPPRAGRSSASSSPAVFFGKTRGVARGASRGQGRPALAPSCCTHYSTRIFPRLDLDLCRGTRHSPLSGRGHSAARHVTVPRM